MSKIPLVEAESINGILFFFVRTESMFLVCWAKGMV